MAALHQALHVLPCRLCSALEEFCKHLAALLEQLVTMLASTNKQQITLETTRDWTLAQPSPNFTHHCSCCPGSSQQGLSPPPHRPTNNSAHVLLVCVPATFPVCLCFNLSYKSYVRNQLPRL
jgi:hypothetical protein